LLNNIMETLPDEDFLVATGFDNAVIGIDIQTMRVIYSVQKCIDILMNDHGMNDEDALEYFEYNVSGAYVGEKTPIWCYDNYTS
jgi:chorismate mutase